MISMGSKTVNYAYCQNEQAGVFCFKKTNESLKAKVQSGCGEMVFWQGVRIRFGGQALVIKKGACINGQQQCHQMPLLWVGLKVLRQVSSVAV